MPVMMPAAGTLSLPYMSCAASCENSKKDVPGSIRASTRSRGSSLPRALCRSWYRSPPPCLICSTVVCRSSTRLCICSTFSMKSAARGLISDVMTAMIYPASEKSSRPMSMRRISDVPAPISYSLASRSNRPVPYSLM